MSNDFLFKHFLQHWVSQQVDSVVKPVETAECSWLWMEALHQDASLGIAGVLYDWALLLARRLVEEPRLLSGKACYEDQTWSNSPAQFLHWDPLSPFHLHWSQLISVDLNWSSTIVHEFCYVLLPFQHFLFDTSGLAKTRKTTLKWLKWPLGFQSIASWHCDLQPNAQCGNTTVASSTTRSRDSRSWIMHWKICHILSHLIYKQIIYKQITFNYILSTFYEALLWRNRLWWNQLSSVGKRALALGVCGRFGALRSCVEMSRTSKSHDIAGPRCLGWPMMNHLIPISVFSRIVQCQYSAQ